jgi:hypothetical protein
MVPIRTREPVALSVLSFGNDESRKTVQRRVLNVYAHVVKIIVLKDIAERTS